MLLLSKCSSFSFDTTSSGPGKLRCFRPLLRSSWGSRIPKKKPNKNSEPFPKCSCSIFFQECVCKIENQWEQGTIRVRGSMMLLDRVPPLTSSGLWPMDSLNTGVGPPREGIFSWAKPTHRPETTHTHTPLSPRGDPSTRPKPAENRWKLFWPSLQGRAMPWPRVIISQ